jgi:inhibitor of KinA sporulation pathway (predicted exonuclease)
MKIQFLDCEMLCWDNIEPPQGQIKHIIQIGIVEVNSEDLKISRSKSYYIRPKNKDFECSDYCSNLTGITRSKILDEGRYFPDAMNTIKKEFGPSSKITYAWGSDYEPIATHCSDYDCSNPWVTSGILDFGIIFRSAYNYKHKMPLIDALKSVGIQFEGRQHDAEWDARNLALLHNKMMMTIRKSML